MKIDNLTPYELQLIISALLFSASGDTTAEWSESDTLDMIDVAVKLKRKMETTPNPLNDKELKVQIASENNCDNLAKIRLITSNFNLKEF